MDFHYIDYKLLYNKEIIEQLELEITCCICKGILNDPKMCLNCQNNFCSICIESIINMNNNNKNVKNCPFRCDNNKFVKNVILNKIISKICKFYCEFGCDEIISYNEINNHFNKCKNNKILNQRQKYEKLLEKFNLIFYKNINLTKSIENKNIKINKLKEEYQNYFNLKEQKENYKQNKYDYNLFIKYNTNPITKDELEDEYNFDYKIKGKKGKNKGHKKYKNKKITVDEYYDNKIKKLKELFIK